MRKEQRRQRYSRIVINQCKRSKSENRIQKPIDIADCDRKYIVQEWLLHSYGSNFFFVSNFNVLTIHEANAAETVVRSTGNNYTKTKQNKRTKFQPAMNLAEQI